MRERRSVLVVSHPNVVPHNQIVYTRLSAHGWDVHLVVPNRWVDDYTPEGWAPVAHPTFTGTFCRVRVARPGAIQRHVYVTRPTLWLRRYRPAALFLEQEPYSVPTLQWGFAAQKLGLPWGIQADDNLDRPLPAPARAIRSWAMPRADFIAARSPSAAQMMRRWGAHGKVAVVPHTIPEWERPKRAERSERFTIGFAGRLVEAKGIRDLLAAAALLQFPFRLLMIGDGPLRAEVESTELVCGELELRTGVRSDSMPAAYAEMDLLVLPSRTTSTWCEQFGKVLCEALLCGVPVVGSTSGEIPWVIESTGGGVVFQEGDRPGLAKTISDLHCDPARRVCLATVGRQGVIDKFSPRVAARELDILLSLAVTR